MNGGWTISMYRGTRSTTVGTKSVVEQEPDEELAVPRPEHREGEAARGRDDDLGRPGADRDHDRVPEVAADVDGRPGFAEVAPGRAVREERHRVRERVRRRRDRRLREPEERPEPDHDEPGEEEQLGGAGAPAHAGPAPVGGRDQTVAGRVAPRRRRRKGRAIIRCSTNGSPAGRRARRARGRRRA